MIFNNVDENDQSLYNYIENVEWKLESKNLIFCKKYHILVKLENKIFSLKASLA